MQTNMQSRRGDLVGLIVVVGMLALVGGAGWGVAPAEAALCPAATIGSLCADLTEPTGVLNLKDTVVTIQKNGKDLPPLTIPATGATGGGIVSTSVPTVPCESATYTASAYSEYSTTLGVMKSLSVTATPGAGVVKDRSTEATCFQAPTNFTLH